MKTSCATIILNEKDEILLGMVTGAKGRMDLPKGLLEPNEQSIDCAIRECLEETGFILEKQRMKDKGIVSYLPAKNLHLFLYPCQASEFDLTKFNCTSFFTLTLKDGKTIEKPEITGVKWVHLANLKEVVSNSLYASIRTVLLQLSP